MINEKLSINNKRLFLAKIAKDAEKGKKWLLKMEKYKF